MKWAEIHDVQNFMAGAVGGDGDVFQAGASGTGNAAYAGSLNGDANAAFNIVQINEMNNQSNVLKNPVLKNEDKFEVDVEGNAYGHDISVRVKDDFDVEIEDSGGARVASASGDVTNSVWSNVDAFNQTISLGFNEQINANSIVNMGGGTVSQGGQIGNTTEHSNNVTESFNTDIMGG